MVHVTSSLTLAALIATPALCASLSQNAEVSTRDINALEERGIGGALFKGLSKVFRKNKGTIGTVAKNGVEQYQNQQQPQQRDFDELYERDFDNELLERDIDFDELYGRDFNELDLESRGYGALIKGLGKGLGRFAGKHHRGAGRVAQNVAEQYQAQQQRRDFEELYGRDFDDEMFERDLESEELYSRGFDEFDLERRGYGAIFKGLGKGLGKFAGKHHKGAGRVAKHAAEQYQAQQQPEQRDLEELYERELEDELFERDFDEEIYARDFDDLESREIDELD